MDRTVTQQLGKGSTGSQVLGLQNFLLEKGYNAEGTLVSDGVFGVKTEMGLRQFQRSHGLRPNGRVDPATQEQLIKEGFPIESTSLTKPEIVSAT